MLSADGWHDAEFAVDFPNELPTPPSRGDENSIFQGQYFGCKDVTLWEATAKWSEKEAVGPVEIEDDGFDFDDFTAAAKNVVTQRSKSAFACLQTTGNRALKSSLILEAAHRGAPARTA
eukprot:Polyplicarium_translucidae@DN5272_c0_g1_i1.p1